MKDTIELLKESDAGLSMAIDSLEDAIRDAKAENFSNMLHKYYAEHKKLKNLTDNKLNAYNCDKKEPNTMGKMGSKMKTTMKMAVDDSDRTIADLMIDGCNMGIKSVSRYMNEYAAANQDVMQLANDIIVLEQNFMNELRQYL